MCPVHLGLVAPGKATKLAAMVGVNYFGRSVKIIVAHHRYPTGSLAAAWTPSREPVAVFDNGAIGFDVAVGGRVKTIGRCLGACCVN